MSEIIDFKMVVGLWYNFHDKELWIFTMIVLDLALNWNNKR